MNFIDIILGIILLWGLIRGLSKGLFVSLASLVALIAGIYFAVHFSHIAGGYLSKSVNWSEGTVNLAAFAITFIIVVVGISLAGKILTKIADFAALGIVNKLLGGLFGLLKMAFIASVLFMFIDGLNQKIELIKKETLEGSLLYQPVRVLAPAILPKILNTDTKESTEADNEETT